MKRRTFFRSLAFLALIAAVPQGLEARAYASMGCYELWYARNSIFANEGYCFTTRRAIRTFGRRCYPPYGRLNRWESAEVERIKYWERRKGCTGGYVPPAPAYAPPPVYSQPPVYAPTPGGYARVVGIRYDDTLAVRTGPSTRYMRIGGLPPNATGVEILECLGSWCRIRYGNLVGWSYAKYLRSY